MFSLLTSLLAFYLLEKGMALPVIPIRDKPLVIMPIRTKDDEFTLKDLRINDVAVSIKDILIEKLHQKKLLEEQKRKQKLLEDGTDTSQKDGDVGNKDHSFEKTRLQKEENKNKNSPQDGTDIKHQEKMSPSANEREAKDNSPSDDDMKDQNYDHLHLNKQLHNADEQNAKQKANDDGATSTDQRDNRLVTETKKEKQTAGSYPNDVDAVKDQKYDHFLQKKRLHNAEEQNTKQTSHDNGVAKTNQRDNHSVQEKTKDKQTSDSSDAGVTSSNEKSVKERQEEQTTKSSNDGFATKAERVIRSANSGVPVTDQPKKDPYVNPHILLNSNLDG